MPVSIYASGIKIPPHIQLTIVAVFGFLTILENGFNASDLSIIDFNIDNLDTIRFAYVLYQDSINDDCKMSDLSWNFNAKGYLQKMKDSEVDTSFCNGIIKITPLIDCEMIITNYNY